MLTKVVFFYFYLPEMKGRTLEELDELFQNRISVRDFAQYQCISSERAKEVATKMVVFDHEKRTTVIKEQDRV